MWWESLFFFLLLRKVLPQAAKRASIHLTNQNSFSCSWKLLSAVCQVKLAKFKMFRNKQEGKHKLWSGRSKGLFNRKREEEVNKERDFDYSLLRHLPKYGVLLLLQWVTHMYVLKHTQVESASSFFQWKICSRFITVSRRACLVQLFFSLKPLVVVRRRRRWRRRQLDDWRHRHRVSIFAFNQIIFQR